MSDAIGPAKPDTYNYLHVAIEDRGWVLEVGAVDFREYLKRKCREQSISLHRLAVRCDLNQIYFYQAVNKNKENPPPWVLRRAAPHLGVTYVELMIAAGHLTEDDLREYGAQTPKAPEKQRDREREKVGV